LPWYLRVRRHSATLSAAPGREKLGDDCNTRIGAKHTILEIGGWMPDVSSSDAAELVRFYDEAYSQDPARSPEYARWRALGAIGKADHVSDLCGRAGIVPASTLEVGCGDGALLCELHSRGFGGRLAGAEITEAAVAIARERPQIDAVALYDGRHLSDLDEAYDLGILSHVLEHVPDPSALLAEVGRVCRAALVEVPLEANVSARRSQKREHATEVGHLQRLDRPAVRRIVERAGLSIACELEDPLPLSVHRFFATSAAARTAGTAKWALRAGLHRLAPFAARRLFTLHYACLCVPAPEQPR
jgi:SAM-dependent methyltransferase